jgi:hypothetical protein
VRRLYQRKARLGAYSYQHASITYGSYGSIFHPSNLSDRRRTTQLRLVGTDSSLRCWSMEKSDDHPRDGSGCCTDSCRMTSFDAERAVICSGKSSRGIINTKKANMVMYIQVLLLEFHKGDWVLRQEWEMRWKLEECQGYQIGLCSNRQSALFCPSTFEVCKDLGGILQHTHDD